MNGHLAPTPPQRMPQALILAVSEEAWEDLHELDSQASVLVDLWSPEHLNRGKPEDVARVNRLNAGIALLEQRVRLGDARGTALSMLLNWYVPEPVLGELTQEESECWVLALQALRRAGQPLEAEPVADFDNWIKQDVWGCLASQSLFEPVAKALMDKGDLRIYVPSQPGFKRWPKDPTSEVLDEGGLINPSSYWVQAIRQGYPLSGALGPQFIARAGEWDMTGEATRAALQTGQVDLHLRWRGGQTVLGVLMEARDEAFIAPNVVAAIVGHDPAVLDACDQQGRALHAVVLEWISGMEQDSTSALALGFNERAASRIGEIARSRRLSLRLDESLPSQELDKAAVKPDRF